MTTDRPSSSARGGDRARPPLRRDAERNRLRILDGARLAFRELGLDASVEQIATRAGVGVGTVYRRFPTKDELVHAIVAEHVASVERLALQALERPEPGEALRWFLHQMVGLQAANRGLRDLMLAHRRRTRAVHAQAVEARAGVRPHIERLLHRAQRAGEVRGDVVLEDVLLLLLSVGGVVELGGRRLLDLLLDGLRPDGASPLGAPPRTGAQFLQALDRAWSD
jgi:AcrR family transcriptional regulator